MCTDNRRKLARASVANLLDLTYAASESRRLSCVLRKRDQLLNLCATLGRASVRLRYFIQRCVTRSATTDVRLQLRLTERSSSSGWSRSPINSTASQSTPSVPAVAFTARVPVASWRRRIGHAGHPLKRVVDAVVVAPFTGATAHSAVADRFFPGTLTKTCMDVLNLCKFLNADAAARRSRAEPNVRSCPSAVCRSY